jgi:hypothetical protein
MGDDQVAQCLKQIGRVDIIEGDFNAKLQRQARANRGRIIEKFAQKHHTYYQSLWRHIWKIRIDGMMFKLTTDKW